MKITMIPWLHRVWLQFRDEKVDVALSQQILHHHLVKLGLKYPSSPKSRLESVEKFWMNPLSGAWFSACLNSKWVMQISQVLSWGRQILCLDKSGLYQAQIRRMLQRVVLENLPATMKKMFCLYDDHHRIQASYFPTEAAFRWIWKMPTWWTWNW